MNHVCCCLQGSCDTLGWVLSCRSLFSTSNKENDYNRTEYIRLSFNMPLYLACTSRFLFRHNCSYRYSTMQFCVTCSKLSTCRVDRQFDAKRLHLHEPSELLPPQLNLDSSSCRYSSMKWLRNTATPRWVWWCLFIAAYFPTFCLEYRMVLFKVLEKFDLCSNCSQNIKWVLACSFSQNFCNCSKVRILVDGKTEKHRWNMHARAMNVSRNMLF